MLMDSKIISWNVRRMNDHSKGPSSRKGLEHGGQT